MFSFQVMYLYYLLGYETFGSKTRDEVIREGKNKDDDSDTGIPRSFRNNLPDKYKSEVNLKAFQKMKKKSLFKEKQSLVK